MFSYVPSDGAAWGLVSDRFVAVVAGDADHALRVWELAGADDAALEDLVEALAADGIRATPDFAVVELVDATRGSVAVAARGTGSVRFAGGADPVSGSGATSWVEAAAEDITGMVVGLGADGEAVLLPLARGVVPAGRVQWGAPVEEEIDEATVLSRRRPRATRLRLRFADGSTLSVDGPLTVGRAPRPADGGRIHILPSPRKEVSGTHALLEVQEEMLRVRDLGSTNGTIVTLSGSGAQVVLRRGEHTLGEGDRVDFGDGNAAVVEAER